MPEAGRRAPGVSVFREYLEDEKLHPGLRRIAEMANQRGLSLRALAKAAERSPATVSVMFNQEHPQRQTLDRLARAVGIDPLTLHAELGDLSESDHEQALSEAIGLARVAGTFTVPAAAAAEQILSAFRSASPEIKDKAARAFVLSRPDFVPITAELLAKASAEAAAAGRGAMHKKGTDGEAADSSSHTLREDTSTQSLRAFAQALGDHGKRLLSLFRADDTEEAIRLIAMGYRLLGFTNDEIRAHMQPALDALQRRVQPNATLLRKQVRK